MHDEYIEEMVTYRFLLVFLLVSFSPFLNFHLLLDFPIGFLPHIFRFVTTFDNVSSYILITVQVLWYSDYGGETNVSLNCSRFCRPIVHPRMNEWMNEWRNYFFNFWKCEAHGRMILTGENQMTQRKTCSSATLSTINPTGLTWVQTWAAVVRGQWLTAWAMAWPQSM
jgi:hypothetical protein